MKKRASDSESLESCKTARLRLRALTISFVRTGRPKRNGSHRCKWKGQGRPAQLLTRSLRGIHARPDINNMADLATKLSNISPTFFLDFLTPEEEDTLFLNDLEEEFVFFSYLFLFFFLGAN